MGMNKILLPVDFPSPSPGMIHQAAFLARRFHSEIILLHVVTTLNYHGGMLESGHELTARDLQAELIERTQKELDESSRSELDGIAVKRLLLRGDPAKEIARMARDEKVDLIVMSTHGDGVLYRFLLGSVAAKVLHESDCPVWTTPHLEETPAREFVIRNILCAVDLSPTAAIPCRGPRRWPLSLARGSRSSTLRPTSRHSAPADLMSTLCGRIRSSASPRRRSPLFSGAWARRPKSSSKVAMPWIC